MDDVVANVTGLLAALAAVVGAGATFIQTRLAWRQSREGAGPHVLRDRYRHIRGWALGGSALALIAVEVAILQGLPRWALMVAVCVVAVVLVALGTAIGYSRAVQVSPASIPIDAQHLEGHWFGTFGNAYFRVQGNRAEAVYDHEDGRILGTIYDGVLDGWWNELPTRQPPDNAGLVHFRMRKEGGKLRLDGEWLYGQEGNWMVWELTEVDKTIPVAVQAKFEDRATFTTG